MLKKFIPFVLISLAAFSLFLSHSYAANKGIKVMVRGEVLTMDSDPVVESGRTLVPLRAVFESLDAYVEWDSKSKIILALKGETSIKIKVGDNTAYLNNVPNKLDVPAKIVKGRTMVPLRFVSEALGATVNWNGSTKTITVTYDGGKEKRYSTIGNISNGGYIGIKDDYIYYALYGAGTVKIKDGSSEKEVLNENALNYMNIVDDWIYCSASFSDQEESEQERLYKIKTDGKSLTRISENKVRHINVVGDWIYYINISDNDTPYKIRIDGKGEQRISKTPVESILVDDGWIYFQRKIDSVLCKMRTSGSNEKVLCSDVTGYFDVNMIGNQIYYKIEGDKPGIYSMNKNGTDKKLVISGSIFSFNYDGDLIYYNDTKYNLYTIKADGSDRKKLATGVNGFLCLAKDWIYYTENPNISLLEDEDAIKDYRIKKDGSVKQRLDVKSQLVDIPISKKIVSSPMPIVLPSEAPPSKVLSTKEIARNKDAVAFIESYEGNEKIASGSGFNIDRTGIVVTNYHVIKGSSVIKCTLGDSSYYVDYVLNFDPIKDIAILKLEVVTDLPVVILGDSNDTDVGENVVAIGNPMEFQNTVSTGVVSGIRLALGQKYIQTTASISSGSSGGPLFNMHGQVIGITTLSLLGTQNINFAISVNSVKDLFPKASKIPISATNNDDYEIEEFEPNDSIKVAEEITPNIFIYGDLKKENDLDCFKFTINSSERICLYGKMNSIDKEAASAISITLSDQNGKVIYTSSVSNEMEVMFQKISANLNAGTYIITVKKSDLEDVEKEFNDYVLIFLLD